MSHSPVPINWAKLWLGVAENSFSAQRYLTEKSSQKILTRKSLALEWQIWVQSIEPNHSQQSNTLQCLHYVLLTVSGKCGTKLCGGLAFQYSIILKLNWVWGLYGSRNLLTIVIGGKVVLGGIIYFFLRGGKISDPIEATLSPQCEAAAVLVAVGQFSLILSLLE